MFMYYIFYFFYSDKKSCDKNFSSTLYQTEDPAKMLLVSTTDGKSKSNKLYTLNTEKNNVNKY